MSFFRRLRDALGLDDTYEYEEDEEEIEDLPPAAELQPRPGSPDRPLRSAPGKVIGLLAQPSEVMLMQPRSFDEAPQAVQALRERKSVVLNLTLIDPSQAQRFADYVAGGAFAVDGHQRHLGENIFLFTPSSVQISQIAPPAPAPRSAESPSAVATRSPNLTSGDLGGAHLGHPQSSPANFAGPSFGKPNLSDPNFGGM